ncbi:MAG: hypothetical protein HQK62_13495 [Desulfamplus sp.]|nr:hypothetical protein [Desulfamplus sp.]
MKTQFLQILQETEALLSWYKEMGVTGLDVSDESVKTVKKWSQKITEGSPNYIKRQPSCEKQAINTKHTQTSIEKRSTSQLRDNGHALMGTTKNESHIIMANSRDFHINRPAPNAKTAPKTYSEPNAKAKTELNSDRVINTDNVHNSYIDWSGDINSQVLFFTEALNYLDPPGELFLNIVKAMNLAQDNICLCTFQALDYTHGIPAVREQVNNIRKEAENFINDIKNSSDMKVAGDIKNRSNLTSISPGKDRLSPMIICTFGDSALKILMGREYMLTTARGRFHNYNGIALMPTYHPAQILADSSLKRWVWEDMKQIMAKLAA